MRPFKDYKQLSEYSLKKEIGKTKLQYSIGLIFGAAFAFMAVLNYFYYAKETIAIIETGAASSSFIMAYLGKRKLKKLEDVLENNSVAD